jgi:hypothetical protein
MFARSPLFVICALILAAAPLHLPKSELVKAAIVYFGEEPEPRRRLHRSLERHLIDLDRYPRANAARQLVETARTNALSDTPIQFEFGNFAGEVSETKGATETYLQLYHHGLAFRSYLSLGDGGGALGQLKKLRLFIEGLTDRQFSDLKLTKRGKSATKHEVLEALEAARVFTEALKLEFKH